MAKHLNKRELVSPRLLLKYNKDNPPSKDTKKKLTEAVKLSAEIMRSTVWKIDRVFFFRRSESYLTDILTDHFRMGWVGETKKDHNKYLNLVRKIMLSTSFHLNTGTYLLDIDGNHRTTIGGNPIVLPTGVTMANVEGYVSNHSSRMLEKGPIHVNFELAKSYSTRGLARLIIHEATHQFSNTVDVFYNHDPQYYTMTADRAVVNADSYAYAALSIHAKQLETWQTLRNDGHH